MEVEDTSGNARRVAARAAFGWPWGQAAEVGEEEIIHSVSRILQFFAVSLLFCSLQPHSSLELNFRVSFRIFM